VNDAELVNTKVQTLLNLHYTWSCCLAV